MADPHHVPELDGFDRLTVQLYRSGLVVAATGLVASSAHHGAAVFGVRVVGPPVLWWWITLGTALAVQDMHLYDKRIRWFIGATAWVGVVLQLLAGEIAGAEALAGAETLVRTAGLGFVFVALSGFAMKEQFCFRIPGLKLVPLFLAASLLGPLLDSPLVTAVAHALAGALLVVLAVAKLRMPLHFDIGDKSHYQI